jgi:hypothetical protein
VPATALATSGWAKRSRWESSSSATWIKTRAHHAREAGVHAGMTGQQRKLGIAEHRQRADNRDAR